MKYLIAFILTICFYCDLHAFEMRKEYDGVVFYKWKMKSTDFLFVTDKDRDDFINAKNSFSTNTAITVLDFENVQPTPDEVSISTSFAPNGQDIKRLLTDKDYLEELIGYEVEILEKYDAIERRTGIDFLDKEFRNKTKSKIEFLKRQYQKIP